MVFSVNFPQSKQSLIYLVLVTRPEGALYGESEHSANSFQFNHLLFLFLNYGTGFLSLEVIQNCHP